MEFVYKIKDEQGKIKEAVASAESPNVLKARLQARGIEVVEIRPRTAGGDLQATWKALNESVLQVDLLERVTIKDMVVFSRQFAAMVSSGVAMLRTLTIIVEQCKNRKLKRCLEDVRQSIEAGLSLSDAMARHPQIFDKLYVSMIKAGETGGILADVLKRLADFLESKSKLNQKVRAAMIYPMVVLVVSILVFWGMLTFILPIFEGLFKNIGSELPAYTQALVALSQAVRSVWAFLFMVGLLIAGWFIKKYYATTAGRLQIDGLIYVTPMLGDLVAKVSIARFSRTFGTLLRAGVPMLTALDVVKDTADNAVVAESIRKIYTDVRQGGSLSKPMTKSQVFPSMVTQMVAVGEETGRLDEMLSKVADFYDMEVENAVEALTSLLEPVMVVGIGGIVGSIVIGMYLPIFTVINQLR
ncbi:MAG: type II secretion system F family protein [Candidatus Obscuribacter phosphatis]|uniref:Type II secretion system F family protein n=1 Tax=Candidatus Obscuribacter phosphatis TaxID=1906157 RepID=A0A8J7PFN7_9BACT|nr:type II secretion system F family protein [Candidatus Obscuribacter phosphatis]